MDNSNSNEQNNMNRSFDAFGSDTPETESRRMEADKLESGSGSTDRAETSQETRCTHTEEQGMDNVNSKSAENSVNNGYTQAGNLDTGSRYSRKENQGMDNSYTQQMSGGYGTTGAQHMNSGYGNTGAQHMYNDYGTTGTQHMNHSFTSAGDQHINNFTSTESAGYNDGSQTPTVKNKKHTERKAAKKNNNGFGRKLAWMACAGAVFGILAGATFQGVKYGSDKLFARTA